MEKDGMQKMNKEIEQEKVMEVTIDPERLKMQQGDAKSRKTSAASDSSGDGSNVAKRARVHNETDINSVPGSSSRMKSISKANCSISSSTSNSTSTHTATVKVQEPRNEERNPIEIALRQPVVLQNIFQFLPCNDLLTCRSVDLPFWSSEANYAIAQHPILKITMNQTETTMKKMKQWGKNQIESQSISELSLKLETCEKGNEIWLKVTEKIELQDLQQFVQKFANVIRKMEFCAENFSGFSLCDLQQLLRGLPNLSHLNLQRSPPEWKSNNERFDSSALLPQVQTVSFRQFNLWPYAYPALFESLLQVLPNLKNVHHFPLSHIEILKVDGTMNLSSIKSVDVDFFDFGRKKMNKLSHLASISSKTRLQRADLSPGDWRESRVENLHMGIWNSCCESWFTILQNNQNTLEFLRIEPFFYPDLLKYPEMKAVKKLELFSMRPCVNFLGLKTHFFGKGVDVGKTFPNLMEVTLRGSSCSLEKFVDLFPEDAFVNNNFKGVTSLELKFDNFGNPKVIKKIAALFPNVTSFYMESKIRWLEIYLPYILMAWPKLISLKWKISLVVVSAQDKKAFKRYMLDPVFTGIPAEKCNELRKHPEKMNINLESYRENSGISTMTDLNDLTLIFYGNYAENLSSRVLPLFSHVTSFYGFQCLPNLKVTCGIPWDEKNSDKIRKMISPMEKHVNFNPSHYEEVELSNPDFFWP